MPHIFFPIGFGRWNQRLKGRKLLRKIMSINKRKDVSSNTDDT